jgi:hypothetical protein
MSESNLDPEIMKKTQETLGKFVKKPPLSEKLLKKPPFKFLFDVICVVSLKRKKKHCLIDYITNKEANKNPDFMFFECYDFSYFFLARV